MHSSVEFAFGNTILDVLVRDLGVPFRTYVDCLGEWTTKLAATYLIA